MEKFNDSEARYLVKKGFAIWFTGMSSAGKTTISNSLRKLFNSYLIPSVILDGDIMRPIVADNLGYSAEDRYKVMLKYLELSKIITKSNIITVVCGINHTEKQRELTRFYHEKEKFAEVWIDTPLEVCMKRDIKGIYKRALNGEMKDVIGINIEYEKPLNSNIKIYTPDITPENAALIIFDYLRKNGVIESFKNAELLL